MDRMFFAAIIIGGLVLSSVCLGYSGGSGTPDQPYQIATKADLLALAEKRPSNKKVNTEDFIDAIAVNLQKKLNG